mgnify:CR=1 FL=1
MREEKLFRAIGDVGDDLIARADEPVQKKKPVRWAGLAALAACCLIAVGLARLVTMGMGNTADSPAAMDTAAPETAMMQAAEEEAKSGSAENGALKSEGADDMMDAAANDAEAPAEEAEAEDAAVTTDTPADSVETWTIGPLTLGMTGDEIQESLGAPDLESNSGPVEETDGSLRVCWFYKIDNDPELLYSVKLDLADFGDGWRLDEVTVWPNVEWKTAEGIGIGSTEDEVRAAYPDAETKDSTLVQDDVEIPRTFFTIGEGRTKLWIMVRDGKVAYLDLGTFFEEPPFEVE